MVRLYFKPSQRNLLPEGKYQFEILDDPEQRVGRNGGEYFIFSLLINFEDGSSRKFSHIITPWETRLGELLLVLGGKKTDLEGVDLDIDDVTGMEFKADVIHVKDPKDPLVIREKLINFKSVESVIEDDDENIF